MTNRSSSLPPLPHVTFSPLPLKTNVNSTHSFFSLLSSFFGKKVAVDKISELQNGANCTLFKKAKKVDIDTSNCFSFNIKSNQNENFTFMASSRTDLVNWVDGLNSLLGLPLIMIETTSEELKTLVDAEMLIRSIDLSSLEISDTKPAIPPPPEDFNFSFSLN